MKRGQSPKKRDGLTKWQRYRLKDLDAYRKKKSAYASTPAQREKRTAYARLWRERNREKHNEQARASHHRNKHKYLARNREWWLRSRYGIGTKDYERMFKAQAGACWICKRRYPKRRLAVDHDHQTKRVRRLLCSKCNGNVGWFERWREIVITYVDKEW